MMQDMKVDLWTLSLAAAISAAVISYNVTAIVGATKRGPQGAMAIESAVKKACHMIQRWQREGQARAGELFLLG